MTERAQKYLYDILNAIELIELFSQGIEDFDAYQADLKSKNAIERQLGIIGEAVTQFKKHETVFELSYMPQMISVRNRLIHAYDNIDDSVIWKIVEQHLAPLKLEVQQALAL
ncbi:MAG: hypothetical protein RLZZ628_3327 [Bacteroidota bacterium]|jgi:uncharacterized protein with HEPN domain